MKSLSLVWLMLLLAACESNKFNYDIVITNVATNLKELNSSFDDYNSDLPYPGQRMDIYFSSNRTSSGGNFDIVGGLMDFSYHEKDDKLNVTIPSNADPTIIPKAVLQKVNTDHDELGPYSYHVGNDQLLMYASDRNGKSCIEFIEIPDWDYSQRDQAVDDPIKVAAIDDFGENLYPSISNDERTLFFCSNRDDTVFSIYSASYNTQISKQSLAEGSIQEIKKETTLSSPYQDKCPYVKDSLMVFASNRPGGSGGYDLWYARFVNNAWTDPVNLNDNINSEYDEYRPVLFSVLGFNLLIFSSNRPGGKGGFDLYIVQINDLES